MSKTMNLNITEIAKKIDVPVEQWKGKCFQVAYTIVRKKVIDDDCRAVYGHYLGKISKKSMFSDRIGMPFVGHGWILLSNDDIIDPTRWVFENVEPYMAYINFYDNIAREYDEGGNEWKKAIAQCAPRYDDSEQCFPLVLDEGTEAYVRELLIDAREEYKDVALNQMFWLANLSLNTLGVFAEAVYTWIGNMGLDATIPIDNRLKILGE